MRSAADPVKQAEVYTTLRHELADLQPEVLRLTLNAQIAMDERLTGCTYAPMQSAPHDFRRHNWFCNKGTPGSAHSGPRLICAWSKARAT